MARKSPRSPSSRVVPKIPVPDPKRFVAATVLAIAVAVPSPSRAAWHVRARGAGDGAGEFPVATVSERAQTIEIQADDAGKVWLTFRLGGSHIRLGRQQCPTLQVDHRLPLIHFPPGAGCTLTPSSATLALGALDERGISSTALYALVNGHRLAVRYIAEDARYHEVVFSLRNSKRAVKRALGGRRIRPN